ncbi:MAG: lipopolysaccharide biosynthesis protein [Thiobacillus sp.]|uniref:lipopolysaccharide biosynthesis protein n=1 Tax=Thiobacillus sp. TaxID=924 RepID=UPI002895C4A8|nr:lipopolysaccharide biosynthesis protein [Thiobacillus sp.]MDT3706860.1 lipopolysaccharide biosynthesis protein [Thiobacillus sp.]
MTETPAKPVRLQSTFIRGAAWGMAMRWGIKLLGLISTVILARIISPEDYGIVAMAMLFAGMAEVLVDFGAQINILRKQTLDRDFIDSAWSLQIIQGGFVATLLALSAPLAGVYFNEPRVVWVIWVIAACLLFDGLTNIGITLARKNFEFKLEFRYRIVGKLIGVVATIIAALFLRDYRALVAGLALGHVSNVFLSYFMHPYRPRWNTAKIRSMWGFSKWLLISGVGTFAARKADQMIAGRMGSAHELGIYNMGSEIGLMPTSELGPPIMRAFLPTLSTIKHDMPRVQAAVLKTLGAINTLTIAAAFGFVAVAEPLTLVLLGEKWIRVAPFLAIFAVVGALRVAVSPFSSLLLLIGHSRLHARMIWIELLVFVMLAAWLAPRFGVIGLAYARLGSTLIYFLTNLYTISTSADIGFSRIGMALWRPLMSAGLMFAALSALPTHMMNIYLDLAFRVAIGVLVYVSALWLSWKSCGQPDGIESLVLARLRLSVHNLPCGSLRK